MKGLIKSLGVCAGGISMFNSKKEIEELKEEIKELRQQVVKLEEFINNFWQESHPKTF